MIIDLSKSALFTVHPDERFATELGLPLGTWTEMWRRYKLLGYDEGELRDYLKLKTGKETSKRQIKRWIIRTEIYSLAAPMIKKGATYATTELFRDFEQDVMNEILKHMRSGGTKDTRILI